MLAEIRKQFKGLYSKIYIHVNSKQDIFPTMDNAVCLPEKMIFPNIHAFTSQFRDHATMELPSIECSKNLIKLCLLKYINFLSVIFQVELSARD